jgi:hypothetical protein
MNRALYRFACHSLLGWLVLVAACSSGNDSGASLGANGGAANGAGARDGSSLGPASGAGNVFLGRSCQRDLDCGKGLVCLLPDSQTLGGEGAPGGYCTRNCAAAPASCVELAPNAACHEFGTALASSRYCVLGCEFGSSLAAEKCQGRRDVACTVVSDGAGSAGACLPRCSSDKDCCGNSGSCKTTCDPATGLCFYGQRKGLSIGSACSLGQQDLCRGFCTTLYGSDGSSTAHVCSEDCTGGDYPACGWAGPSSGPAGALCSSAVPGAAAGSSAAAGDAGYCVALCDCDRDCASAETRCQPFSDVSLALATQRTGACLPRTPTSVVTACGGTTSATSASPASALGSAGVGGGAGTAGAL